MLYLAVVVTRVGFGTLVILFPIYLGAASSLSLAAILSLYPILEAVTAVPLGILCDTHGRRRIFLGGIAAMLILMGAVGTTANLVTVAALHAVMGAAAAAITVSSLTMITDLTHESNRGKGMGTFDFANIGGYALGLLLGGRLLTVFAGHLGESFLVTAALTAGALAVSLLLVKEPLHAVQRGRASLNPTAGMDARSKAVLPVWIGVTSLIGVAFFLPRVFNDIGIQAMLTGELLAAGVLVLGVGSVGFGALSDRVGRAKTIAIGAVGLLGLLATLGATFRPGGQLPLVAVPPLVVFAVMTSALVPSILATVGDRTKAEARGSAMGIYSVMLSGGSAVGTLIAGLAHTEGGFSGVLEAAAGIFAVACALSLWLWLRATRSEGAKPL